MTTATDAYLAKWKGHSAHRAGRGAARPVHRIARAPARSEAAFDKHGAPILLHVAESKQEIETVREKIPSHARRTSRQARPACPRLIAKHVVWATDDELLLLKKHDVGIAHCPQSNMKLASGIAPVPKMLELKLAAGLGTDGPASNNDLDMWEEIDTAAKLHKVATGDPTVVSARQALGMATIDGARAVHMAERIARWKSAKRPILFSSASTRRTKPPSMTSIRTWFMRPKRATYAPYVVAGRVIVEDRKTATLDPEAIRRDAVRYRDEIRTLLAK